MKAQSHENFSRAVQHDAASSRSFGVVFAVVLTGFGLMPLMYSGTPHWLAVGIGAAFALIAALRPSLLHVPAALWAGLGLVIARLTNPIVLTALFVLVFIPASALFRLLGKDPLRRHREQTDSWWVVRDPPGPAPASMAKQF